MPQIILASTSPRRKEILSLLGLPFAIAKPLYEENNNLPLKHEELVKHLAFKKAESLISSFPDAIIIGSDTLVELYGKILSKPKTNEKAIEMFLSLSGTTHNILTGYALVDTSSLKKDIGVQKTIVTFKKITSDEAEAYVNRENVLDIAGAYNHERLGAVFVEKIEGDFYSSIGFPLSSIAKSLTDIFGFNILHK